MPGLVAIIAEPGRPDLGPALDRMLGAMAQPDYHTTRLVWPELGIALGHTGSARFADRQMCASMSGSLPGVIALLDGEPLDLPAVAGRLGLPAEAPAAEVIAALYDRDGADALGQFDGHWAVALVDRSRGRVVIANDPFGMRPLYRTRPPDGAWLVASHPAALLAYPAAPRALNPAGLADYLAFGHPWGGKTLFAGVEMLPAASLLIFANGQMQARRYWIPAISYQSSVISYQLSVISHQPSAISTELEAVRQLFNESVARSVAAGRPFSLALTGGMDARAVLSALVAAGIRPPTVIHAVSGSTDALLAAELAQRAGAEHHFFEVRGEALPDLIRPGVYALGGQVAAIDVHPLCFLADLLRFTEVMFTGLGAEVTRGEYPAADADPRHDTPATVARKMLASYGKVFGPETDLPALLNEDWQPGLLSRPLRSMEEAIAAAGDVPLTEVSGVADLQERVPRFWVKGELIVRRELETRHPFLNRPLMMRIWSLPRAVRWAGLAHRYIITRNAPALADVPYEHDGLPLRYPFTRGDEWRLAWKRARRRITDRLGQPYRRVPNYRYADWLRGPLRPLLTDVLLDPAATTRPYFKPGAVQKLYHEHIAGQDHTTKLAALLALELTVRMFMETS